MSMRVGKVTKVDPSSKKVVVLYEDTKNTSLPLPVVSMPGVYSLPSVGDRVVTLHMDNGSSKGFVIGSYFVGNTQADAVSIIELIELIEIVTDLTERLERAENTLRSLKAL